MDADVERAEPPLASVGPQLRRAREAAGKTLADISAATKIPERLLTAVEEGRFSALPSRTYAFGFARSYARAVGLDEARIADEVRAEIDGAISDGDGAQAQGFGPGDPARVPGKRLALVAGLGAVAVIGAVLIFWRGAFDSGGTLPSALPPDRPAQAKAAARPGAIAPAATPAAPVGGAVSFTALAPGIWVKIYETGGKVLMERQMAQGEAYTLPADAQAPLIWTGRPDALAIAIGGRPVAKLADKQKTMKGIPVSAAALLARPPAPLPTPAAAIAPAPSGQGANPATPATAAPTNPSPATQ